MNETAIATPGVYVSEISTLPPSIAQVSTAIPAFIGYTQIALDSNGVSLTGIPTKIFNFKEYEQYFGKAENEQGITVDVIQQTTPPVSLSAVAKIATPSIHNMYYSLRHYFDNAGGPCYIVSTGATTAAAIADTDLLAAVDTLEAYDEPTLYVFPEAQNITDESKFYALFAHAIDSCAKLQDRFTIVDIYAQAANTNTTISNFRNVLPHTTGFNKNNNLNYAAAYYPNLKTTYEYQYIDGDVQVNLTKNGGPATNPLLDSLLTTDSVVYYAAKNAVKKLGPILPPSPAIVGVYANTDANRGVWKAPANVSINSIYDVTDFVTDEEQGTMNIDAGSGKSVNAIRPFNGKGILVWGARTLDGNSSEWRYVSVRRLFIMVEESTKKATMQFVFEPNDANTWTKIRAMIENYLTLLWREGALAGAKPEHAFFVKCGLGQTMTAQDILDGRLIVEIGMAAVRPAEFIILRFMHKLQES
ncbi:MAG TPA: phage tail sheath C-terminal domain-containing protein [Chitinophagaceae bacterium]|nr:phage tail sheath C-terminal domain-containing protein [Chitinophagaceae bacterium]